MKKRKTTTPNCEEPNITNYAASKVCKSISSRVQKYCKKIRIKLIKNKRRVEPKIKRNYLELYLASADLEPYIPAALDPLPLV